MNLLNLVPRFRQARRSVEALAGQEGLTRTDIEALQLEHLNHVWQHAIGHVPYYQALAGGGGLPKAFANLDEYRAAVPVLRKPAVAADPERFRSDEAEAGFWKRTGGSTGRPLTVYWGEQAHREMLAARYRYYQAWGVDFTDRSAMLWGNSGALQPGWPGRRNRMRTPVEDRLRRRLRLSTYDLRDGTLTEYLRRIEAWRPATLYGFSSSVHLLATAAAGGFDCPALRLVTLTGEPTFDYIREAVEQNLGAAATVEYGAAEAPIIASEMPDRTLRVREDLVYLETLPAEDGRFSIVISVLNNPSFPLLRYETADLTDTPLAADQEGFAILGNVAGRTGDLVITGSGTPMHLARIDAFFKYQVAGVRRFRLHQHADRTVRAMVEVEGTFEQERTARKLTELLDGLDVTIDVVEAIPSSEAGKHRLVMSDVA
jgi:phenylacetate-CoA ligase